MKSLLIGFVLFKLFIAVEDEHPFFSIQFVEIRGLGVIVGNT